jgi:hypothetical protein
MAYPIRERPTTPPVIKEQVTTAVRITQWVAIVHPITVQPTTAVASTALAAPAMNILLRQLPIIALATMPQAMVVMTIPRLILREN